MKKLLLFFTLFFSSVTLFAGRHFNVGDILYVDCSSVSWWCDANAVQTLVFVDNSGNKTNVEGLEMLDVTRNNIYVFGVYLGTYEYVYLQRSDPATGTVWNKTGNIPLSGTDQYDFIKSFSENSSDVVWGNISDGPEIDVTYQLYVTDYMAQWNNLYVYAYGGKELFGTWPGTNVREAVKINNEYKLSMTGKKNSVVNLIFNNGASEQFDSNTFQLNGDYHVVAATATDLNNILSNKNYEKAIIKNNFIIIKQDKMYNIEGFQIK